MSPAVSEEGVERWRVDTWQDNEATNKQPTGCCPAQVGFQPMRRVGVGRQQWLLAKMVYDLWVYQCL